MVLDGKFSQEYSVIARVHQGSILRPTLFLLCINELPDDVICTSAICADDTTHYSKCDQASDLWEQPGLVSELESGLQDIVDCFRKRTVDFIAEKTQLVSFDHPNMKIEGLFLRKNHILKCWGCLFLLNLIGALILSLLLELLLRKL